MRFLFVAAVGAAVVFASPVYAAGYEKKSLFNEKQCSYLALRLQRQYDSFLAGSQKYQEAVTKNDWETANKTQGNQKRI